MEERRKRQKTKGAADAPKPNQADEKKSIFLRSPKLLGNDGNEKRRFEDFWKQSETNTKKLHSKKGPKQRGFDDALKNF
jgi:hypothetical protein